MNYKTFFPILFIFCFHLCQAQSPLLVEGDSLLLQKYCNYKERFYRNFIRIDWGGDGIGQYQAWQAGSPLNGLFEKAGYSLPAAEHLPTEHGIWYWRYNKANGPSAACQLQDPSLRDNNLGVLSWGDDATANMGIYLAVLSTEYALLLKSGQVERSQQSLEEIYLALQALRRLNLSANYWVQRYLEVRTDFECKKDWTMDSSGFSKLYIRNDVPYDFWKVFRLEEKKHPEYGVINPIATDEFGRSSGEAPSYDCPVYPDGVPDISGVIGAQATCGVSDALCGRNNKDCQFLGLSPNDSNYLAYEILAEKFLSQDQVIGILFGLSFVHKYIPKGTVFQAPAGPVDILELLQQIAPSLDLVPTGRVVIPECLGKTGSFSGMNQCGYHWHGSSKAICVIIAKLMEGNWRKCGNPNSQLNLLQIGFGTKKPIQAGEELRRMNYTFYQTLSSLSNAVPLSKTVQYSDDFSPWIAPFYPLVRKSLQNIDDKAFIKNGRGNTAHYKEQLLQILSSYAFQGNCIPAKDPTTDCQANAAKNYWPKADIPCQSNYVYRPEEISSNRLGVWTNYSKDSFYGNGLDYMLLFNLYCLEYARDLNYELQLFFPK